MKTICLFRCTSIKQDYWSVETGQREYEFGAVYDTSIPEQARFAAATPQGYVKITVTNPAVQYELGKEYYFVIEAKEKEESKE